MTFVLCKGLGGDAEYPRMAHALYQDDVLMVIGSLSIAHKILGTIWIHMAYRFWAANPFLTRVADGGGRAGGHCWW